MAIFIQPVANFQPTSTAALTPSPDLIAQLAQTNLANSPNISVVVTLGNGEPAILIYNAHGMLQEVLFDFAPPPTTSGAAAQALPALTSLEGSHQEHANAVTSIATANASPPGPEALLNTPETQQPQSTAVTPPASAASLNITPAGTAQNNIAAAAQQAFNVAATSITVTAQAFSTIPTTAVNENLLQNLLAQAANQALTTISSDPSYANSLAALLLSSGTARIRIIDDTGTLLNTPEPVGPVRATTRARL